MSNLIFNTLQDCEKKLKFHISGGKNEAEKQIQKNVQQTYLARLKEITMNFRKIERQHLAKISEFTDEENPMSGDLIDVQ